MTYPENLIYGEFNDETVAKLVVTDSEDKDQPVDKDHSWLMMFDGSFQTYWKNDQNEIKVKFSFAFPIIFEKLVIVKRLDKPEPRRKYSG